MNVLKIKQEIENGRRLNTAMRNNHVDLVALDSILKNSPTESLASYQEPPTEIKSNCITADSLKEIRRRLRKLSNEFLYKDDMSSIDENNMSEDLNTGSYEPTQHNSKSLELRNRSKERELGLEDWHNRRKSYGFEKMFQQYSHVLILLQNEFPFYKTQHAFDVEHFHLKYPHVMNISPHNSHSNEPLTFCGQ